MKGVMGFGIKEKLSPQYIGPYEIIKCVGDATYELRSSVRISNCSSSVLCVC